MGAALQIATNQGSINSVMQARVSRAVVQYKD